MPNVSLALLLVPAAAAAGPATYDGRYDISKIHVTAVYFVPKGREPLADWKDRVSYFARRMEAFHRRESGGRSVLKVALRPTPVVSDSPPAAFRRGGRNRTFFDTMNEVKSLTRWRPDDKNGFPILLVFSDINYREMDDFRRVRVVKGEEVPDGHVGRAGRHRPGSRSGGARATYIARRGYGMGLVSADGWRVPYCGSDCVAYHEGVGHPIGLPHPEPADRSVMSTAQYHGWLHQTRVNDFQRRKLGWTPPGVEPAPATDLFTHFAARHEPPVPRPGQPVTLSLRWPKGAKVKSLTVRTQTALRGSWRTTPVTPKGRPPASVPLGKYAGPTPVSYRIDVKLEDGQAAELWGYFQVRR